MTLLSESPTDEDAVRGIAELRDDALSNTSHGLAYLLCQLHHVYSLRLANGSILPVPGGCELDHELGHRMLDVTETDRLLGMSTERLLANNWLEPTADALIEGLRKLQADAPHKIISMITEQLQNDIKLMKAPMDMQEEYMAPSQAASKMHKRMIGTAVGELSTASEPRFFSTTSRPRLLPIVSKPRFMSTVSGPRFLQAPINTQGGRRKRMASAATQRKATRGKWAGYDQKPRLLDYKIRRKWFAFSPTETLGMVLRIRGNLHILKHSKLRLVQSLARMRTTRLPFITAQYLLRQQLLRPGAPNTNPYYSVALCLENDLSWERRLEDLKSSKGYTTEDLSQWTWILNAETADIAVQRFLSSPCRKPVFLLMMLVAKDKVYHKAESLASLLQFMHRTYLEEKLNPEIKSNNEPSEDGLNSDSGIEPERIQPEAEPIQPDYFCILSRRLIEQCLRSWPAALPSVAMFIAAYIQTVRQNYFKDPGRGQAIMSRILNKSISLLGQLPSVRRSLDMSKYNWEAQKILLSLSSTVKPHLPINRESYRNIRRIMITLKKSSAERKAAERVTKTWPHYRQSWDGIDEQRNPEDDYSRSTKAGILMQEAGYQPEAYDRALEILGGSGPGRAPTTQTRTVLPRIFTGKNAQLNIYIEWLAQVKATRDTREAWKMFQSPPQPDLKPNALIYTEMFRKLYARQVKSRRGDPSRLLPGDDATVVFEPYNGNLSPYELARLEPPTPEQLLKRMRDDGVTLTRDCLAVLIKNAPSPDISLQLLEQSVFKDHVPTLLRDPQGNPDALRNKELARLGRKIINAWVWMLCHTSSPGRCQVSEAIKITECFHAAHPHARHHDKTPWHIIFYCLAGGGFIKTNSGWRETFRVSLEVFMRIYDDKVCQKEADVTYLDALTTMVRKAVHMVVFASTQEKLELQTTMRAPHPRTLGLIREAQDKLNDIFEQLIRPIPNGGGSLQLPSFRHDLMAENVLRYMLALGSLGDGERMVRLMEWTLDSWDTEQQLEDAKWPSDPGYQKIIELIKYFVGMGELLIPAEVMERVLDRLESVRKEKGCTWYVSHGWPEENSWPPADTGFGSGHSTGPSEIDFDRTAAARWREIQHQHGFLVETERV